MMMNEGTRGTNATGVSSTGAPSGMPLPPKPPSHSGGGHGGGGYAELPHSAQEHVEEGGEGNWLVSYADMMTLLVGFFIILMSFSTIDEAKFEEVKKAAVQQFGGVYQVPFEQLSTKLREEINKLGLGDQVIIKQTDLGIEISFLGTVFFETGSADVKTAALKLLDQIIPIISAESKSFNILVEGHTDDVPIVANSTTVPYKNNWELSSIRACRVVTEFQSRGYDLKNLTAVGFGEARPLVPNRNESGVAIPENQAQNRRVMIKLLKPTQSAVGGEAAQQIPHSPQDHSDGQS